MFKQRELTFRLFNFQSGEYDRDMFPAADVTQEGYFTFIAQPDQFLVEQSTGVIDSTGRRIFENDVIAESTHGTITYYHVYFTKSGAPVATSSNTGVTLRLHHRLTVKVVGTVHDKEYKQHETSLHDQADK